MAKRRQGRTYWAKLISEFDSNGGGESHATFAARHGVRLTTFRTWLYRLRMQAAPRAKRAVRVLPVTVIGAGRSGRDLSIDCNGFALRFAADTDPSYVAALVVALRALTLPPSVRIYLAVDKVDMRCGHDGLGAIVRNQWRLDIFEGHLFVFVGRKGDRVKILFWDRGGFVLYYKRLERGRFRLPHVTATARTVEMDATELGMLLDGIDVSRVRRPAKWEPRRAEGAAATPPR